MNLEFAILMRLAGQRAMGIHSSLHCQVLELQIYITMSPFYVGAATLNSDTHLCGKHFTQGFIFLAPKTTLPMERKMNSKSTNTILSNLGL